jgi:transposase-like protein
VKATLITLADQLRTEADAYQHLESLRWPEGVECPTCGGSDVYLIQPKNGISRKATNGAMSERRVWNCRHCRRQFSAISGTVMHGTKASVRVWCLVMFDMICAKNGISAREVERKYGVCARTAWFMCHRIRECMKSDALIATMRGTIVADETWIGGEPANRHAGQHQEPTTRHDGLPNLHTEKTPVLSLINATTGEVRSRVLPNVTAPNLRKFISDHVDMAGSTLYTDEAKYYDQIGAEFALHEAVNHSAGEYVRGKVTTNRAEGYFGQLKRSLSGTYHHVSREHLPRYLAEFDFRYSTCRVSDAARMAAVVRRGEGRRLTYKRTKTSA